MLGATCSLVWLGELGPVVWFLWLCRPGWWRLVSWGTFGMGCHLHIGAVVGAGPWDPVFVAALAHLVALHAMGACGAGCHLRIGVAGGLGPGVRFLWRR